MEVYQGVKQKSKKKKKYHINGSTKKKDGILHVCTSYHGS